MPLPITPHDPHSAPARVMFDALWDEIQRRYGFTAPNPMQPEAFTGRGGLWLAWDGDQPVGSIGLTPLTDAVAELDAMYVAPGFRGRGVAQTLLDALEAHARQHRFAAVRLRTGDPQPEAVRFYEKAGFHRIPAFGRWATDPTAWCFEKRLS